VPSIVAKKGISDNLGSSCSILFTIIWSIRSGVAARSAIASEAISYHVVMTDSPAVGANLVFALTITINKIWAITRIAPT
jgi:hypothetical protein